MTKENVMIDSELLKKINDHNRNYKYNFSNHYFINKLWKKDYIEKYGSLPANVPIQAKKVSEYINAQTGKVEKELPKGAKEIVLRQNHETYFQIEYVKELNCIVVEYWDVDLRKKQIKKRDFFYIDSKKRLYGKHYSNQDLILLNMKDYAKAISWICMGSCLRKDQEKMYYNAFDPLFPISFYGGNLHAFIRTNYYFESFMKQKEVVKKAGKMQNIIDELCSIELRDVRNMVQGQRNSYGRIASTCVVASRLNEEYAVLRWFCSDPKYKKVIETARFFVSKKNAYFCRINSFGEFVHMPNTLGGWNFLAEKYLQESDDVLKGTILEYFQEAVKEFNQDEKKIRILWLFTSFPIAEKMWKTNDYKHFIHSYLNMYYAGNFKNHLEDMFGTVDLKAKTIKRALGLNDYQIKRFTDEKDELYPYHNAACRAIKILKYMLNEHDIAYMDNQTYDTLMDFIIEANRKYYAVGELLNNLYSMYSMKTVLKVIQSFNDLEKTKRKGQGIAYGAAHNNMIALYADYIRIAKRINDNGFSPYFSTVDDLVRMHDAAVLVYNLKANTFKKELFEKRIHVWKNWEFEKDNTYLVVAPTEPNDLAKEGITLHHCVKSYIDRVADGKTNIMFIRKKDEPDKPFFTVEVDNNKKIQQVHGFANCTVDTVDGLLEFVESWAKDKTLTLNNINKIR